MQNGQMHRYCVHHQQKGFEWVTRRTTRTRWLMLIIIVVMITLWLPTPYVIIEPGDAFHVEPMVDIAAHQPLSSGHLMMTTVRMSYANGSGLLRAFFDRQAHVFLKSSVLQGQTPQQYSDKQQRYMHASQNDAIQAAYNKAGIRYTIVPNENDMLLIQPESQDQFVHITAGEIGGPSAGLVFALEIYNRLTAEDLTKGYSIAGTGEIDPKGRVGAIGGIEYKVVAADRAGADIFFVPQLNWEVAIRQAERIHTDMRIIAVTSMDDVLQYMDQLPVKHSGD